MFTISVASAINGYIVTIHNRDEQKPYREICEREIDAWEIVQNYATQQIKRGVDNIIKSSTDVEI